MNRKEIVRDMTDALILAAEGSCFLTPPEYRQLLRAIVHSALTELSGGVSTYYFAGGENPLT